MTTPSDRIIEFHTVTPGPRFSIPSSILTAAKDSSSPIVQRVEEHGVFLHWFAMLHILGRYYTAVKTLHQTDWC